MTRIKLIKQELGDLDVFISPEMLRQYELNGFAPHEIDASHKTAARRFLNSDHYFQEFVRANAEFRGLEREAMLHAHGIDNGTWNYVLVGENFRSVQRWINQNDGKYSLLLLNCCNTRHREVKSKKSCILVPDTDYQFAAHEVGDVNVELYVPGIGYVDGYTWEEQLKNLKKL